jgi:Glyoxalase superfamily protein/ClpX C4-type zinc finger
MRTLKDAKAMAKQLRHSLAARKVSLSHSECLEIVAKQFGFDDWNTLSAKVRVQSGQAAMPDAASRTSRSESVQLSCSFCGKSRGEVRTLIEGACGNQGTASCVFICDECVAFSAKINADTCSLAESGDSELD